MTEVRTRFAPSPTGMQHIGGFRTALFAWLLARHHGGKFLLRIEDTDQERKVPGAIQFILEGFEWLGIDIDEGPSDAELRAVDPTVTISPGLSGDYGPYVQSLRRDRYTPVAERLISEGHAFRCDCTAEMLQREREEQSQRKETPGYAGRCRDRNVSADVPHVVRFRMPEDTSLTMMDGVRGEISWKSVPLRDPVIMKSDGLPLYHLAVVVDDHEMKISHAMRGEEWIPSAPLHLMLYKALGWEPPVFCHLPVVNGPDGKKLSKRHGATTWEVFREDGYLPEALMNFIALLGWSPGGGEEQEVFTKAELVEKFSIERVNASSAVFEYSKLDWMNGHYLRALSPEEFERRVSPFLENAGFQIGGNIPKARWDLIAPLLQERAKKLSDLPGMVGCLSDEPLERDLQDMLSPKLDSAGAVKVLQQVHSSLRGVTDWEPDQIDLTLKSTVEELGIKAGMVFLPVRIAVLGKKTTPPLTESLHALGKEVSLKRLEEATALVQEL